MKIFIIALLALVGVKVVQADTNDIHLTITQNSSNIVITPKPILVVECGHYWWETGTFTASMVANMRQEDISTSNHWQRIIDRDGPSKWLLEHQKPKYSHITTNTVHWMKAHAPVYTNTTPYIEITAWNNWGWMNIYWKSKLTDPKWERVCCLQDQHFGVNKYRIYMHPKSKLTQRMLKSKTGFFSQNCKPLKIYGVLQTYKMGKIYSFDMSHFFPNDPKPVVKATPIDSRSGPPPIPK